MYISIISVYIIIGVCIIIVYQISAKSLSGRVTRLGRKSWLSGRWGEGRKSEALVYMCALGVLEIIPLYNTRMYVYINLV